MTILEEYEKKHPTSGKLFEEAQTLIPGGVTHDGRYIRPFPVYMKKAAGSRKWDVDDNEYIGYVMGHGSLILGHCQSEIVKEVQLQVETGTHLGSNTEVELRWARAVKINAVIERIRFHSSGTEATLMAMRLARDFTGKKKIVKFTYHFHGWHDYVTAATGPKGSPGVPAEIADTVIILPAGDIPAVAKTLQEDRDIAAVILEPTGAKGGALPLPPEFSKELRELTEQHGVLLIFDEVIAGFRVSSGGAQERFGVKPDLTTLAKILAGGFPGGAVGGRTEIMDLLAFHDDPAWNSQRKIAHPGTFNANPVSAAAGARCLEIIDSQPINRNVWESSLRLRKGLNEALKSLGCRGFAYGFPGSIWVVFGIEYHGDLDVCTLPHDKLLEALTAPAMQTFRLAMLNEGIDLWDSYWFILSSAHTDKDIERALTSFERAVGKMMKEGIL